MIFPNEEKLPTPLNYIIVLWLWVCARSDLPTILVSSHVCVLLAACYKMASKLRWTCVYYSLENESKSDERKWIHYEITERNLLALIWVKKIPQAPELPLFSSLNRIECLPHTNRMFMSPYIWSLQNRIWQQQNKNLKPHFNWVIMHDPVAD